MTPIAQRLALAAQHHDAGRLQEAERLYRAILQESPQNPHALHLLGVLSHQLGKHQEAIELIQKALSAHGPHPVFHSNLAAAYLAIDRLLEAAAHAQEAVRLQPDFANGHNNLGIAQRGLGQLDAAARAFREALRLQPQYVDALCNLGTVLHRQEKLAEATTVLREAIRLSPSYAQAHNNLGGVLLALNQFEAAAQHLNEAVRLKPDFANAHSNLGVALEHLNRIDEAIQCFRTSIRLDPNYAAAHNNLGSALKNLGKTDEALHEYKEAQRIDPDNGVTLFNLSKLAAVGRYTFSDAEVEHIQELTTRPNIAPDNRSRLHFALAQVHERNGAYDEAFAHCRRANDLTKEVFRNRGSVFDPAAHAQRIDQLIAAYTPAYFERVRGFGNDTELPIFIVGMPRSGSTLAEQILASHPKVHGAGELADIDRLINAMTERIGKTVGYPKCLDKLDAATVQSFAAGYLQELKQLGGAAERVIDKAPFNFYHLGMLQTLYPRARIIHCRRDAVDTCLSCYFQSFAVLYPFTLDLQHLGSFYRGYERLMAHWRQVLPAPIFELNYEELTADQETLSRRLVEFCGLAWDERCLRFHETPRLVRTFSTLQVRQPMYKSAVGRWKRYEKHLQPLLQALGSARQS